MKKSFIALSIMALATFAFAGPSPTLPAPENFVCSNDGTYIYASWDAVDGAKKYSVEVEGTYTVDGEEVTRTFEFTTTDPSFSAAIGGFDSQVFDCLAGVGACTVDADSLSVKVKALSAGGGRGPHRSQNNPFTGPCDPLD